MRSEFQIPEKAELCRLNVERLTRDLQDRARSTVKLGYHTTVHGGAARHLSIVIPASESRNLLSLCVTSLNA